MELKMNYAYSVQFSYLFASISRIRFARLTEQNFLTFLIYIYCENLHTNKTSLKYIDNQIVMIYFVCEHLYFKYLRLLITFMEKG